MHPGGPPRPIWGGGGGAPDPAGGGKGRSGRRRGGNKSSHSAGQAQLVSPQWAPSMSLAGFNGDTSYNGPSPSEYYGSMAAGSIVGASSRGARQGM